MTSNDNRPRYQQVADDLRRQIANGTLAIGAELPSTPRLMERYGTSITVVRRAVNELRNENLVVGQPGKAVYVRERPENAPPSNEYAEIKQQIQDLRVALDEAVQSIDQRISELEQRLKPER